MTIEGTSTLHDWISDVTKLEFSGNLVTEGARLKEVKDVNVKIPVESIKSTKGKMMDNKTWEAFKYDKYPAITYRLVTLSVHDGLLKTTGALTMAGAAQSIAMEIQYTVMPSGEIRFTGSHKIKMKDYKMEPPTAMMGTIKVGEEVIVRFDLTITPNK
ncbi:MAG: YceI family protein [Flammeovirgaceae bacterium]|nr:MAG: YceI family protein [Flammeovirgaceae bacterium]